MDIVFFFDCPSFNVKLIKKKKNFRHSTNNYYGDYSSVSHTLLFLIYVSHSESFIFAILLAQVKIILLYLFKVMFLYTNALIHSFESVFNALVEIFFLETFHFLLDSSIKFINVLESFSTKLFFNFGNSHKSHGLKSGEYAG